MIWILSEKKEFGKFRNLSHHYRWTNQKFVFIEKIEFDQAPLTFLNNFEIS